MPWDINNCKFQWGKFQQDAEGTVKYPTAYKGAGTYGIGMSLGVNTSSSLSLFRMPRNLTATGFEYTYKSSYSPTDSRWITIGY